jgi:hypothetical protein
MTTTQQTVQTLAEQVYSAFIKDKRTNDNEFLKLKDGSPQWMTDLCHACHRTGQGVWDVMLPDDWRYAFIHEVAGIMSEANADDLDCPNLEPDIYTHELTSWLNSRADKFGYCEGLVDGKDALQTIGMGQMREKEEVYYQALAFLREMVEEMETNTDEEPPFSE